MNRKCFHLIASLLLIFISCKKENADFHLVGKVTNGNTGSALGGTTVDIQKQVVSGGSFNAVFSSATSGTTDSGGNYDLKWPRENFAELKVVASRAQFITKEIELNISDFDGGSTVTQNLSLFPQAFIQVNITNANLTAPGDDLTFRFTNALFECTCCNNAWKSFDGPSVDTTFECMLYGDRWLHYEWHAESPDDTLSVADSIWCPSFETTELNISY